MRLYCTSLGGDLPVMQDLIFEYLYCINKKAKPWPVYIGLTEVKFIFTLYLNIFTS